MSFEINKYMQEWREKQNEIFKDDCDWAYYCILNALDNIRQIAIDKYGNLNAAARAIGSSRKALVDFLDARYLVGMRAFCKYCKAFNIGLHYVFFKKGERHWTIDKISFTNLKKTYDACYWMCKYYRIGNSISMAIARRTNTVPLKYVLKIAKEQRKTVDWLLGGNDDNACERKCI